MTNEKFNIGRIINFYISPYTSKKKKYKTNNEYLPDIDVLEISIDDRNILNKFSSYEESKDLYLK